MTAAKEWAGLSDADRTDVVDHLRAMAKRNEDAVVAFRSGGNSFWVAVCTRNARMVRAAIAVLEEASKGDDL